MSYKGMSCKNCKNMLQVMKHPMNTGESDGSIFELFGYICTGLKDTNFFMEKDDGMCEEWTKEKSNKE